MSKRIKSEFLRRCKISGRSNGIRQEADGSYTVTHSGRVLWNGTLAEAMQIADGGLV